QIYITGSETTEGYQNNPQAGRFPFVRNNVFLDKGCLAPFSLVKSNSSFYMIGAGVNESPSVWQFKDNQYIKISTPPIDFLLASLTDTELEEVFAVTYAEEGHFFVAFALPSVTMFYDLATKRWHERNSVITEDEGEESEEDVETRWRVNSIITAYGLLLVGDSQDGRIGTLSYNNLTEYGNNIIRLFTTQPFTNMGNEITSTMIELTMESGAGNFDVPDPVVSMAASANSKTFTNERVRKIGKKGEYERRIVWYKNGRQDRWVVWQFRMSEPVKSAFIKLEFE
ncbi:unnamed protein product, partial [marine sediment metagenome]